MRLRERGTTKSLLLTFDVEEFDWPRELGRPLAPGTECDITAAGLERILPTLARHDVRATFFVTGSFAATKPECVRAIVAARHEIAVHGLAHADDYARMDPAVATDRLQQARALVERVGGQPAEGIRTPRLRPCPPAVLRRAGFAYDASPHPTWVPGRYNGLRLPREPWCEDGLVRVPISVLPLVRLPVSWLWYRCAGPRLGPVLAVAAGAGTPYVHLYFHPWEALDLVPYGVPRWLATRTGDAFVEALDRLLVRCAGAFAPRTVSEFVEIARASLPGDG